MYSMKIFDNEILLELYLLRSLELKNLDFLEAIFVYAYTYLYEESAEYDSSKKEKNRHTMLYISTEKCKSIDYFFLF